MVMNILYDVLDFSLQMLDTCKWGDRAANTTRDQRDELSFEHSRCLRHKDAARDAIPGECCWTGYPRPIHTMPKFYKDGAYYIQGTQFLIRQFFIMQS